MTVQNKKSLHGCVANPFVPVHEGMIHDERVAQGGGLGNKVGIKILAAKGGMRLTDGRFKCAKVTHTGGPARSCKQPFMEVKDFGY